MWIDLAATGCCGVLPERWSAVAGPAFVFHEIPLYPARRLTSAHHNEDHIASVHRPGRIDCTQRIIAAACSCDMGAALDAIMIVETGLTLGHFYPVAFTAGCGVAGGLEAGRCVYSVAAGLSIGSNAGETGENQAGQSNCKSLFHNNTPRLCFVEVMQNRGQT